MKISNTFWFWVLQFLGWGSLSLFNTLFKLAAKPELNKTYTILEGLILLSLGLFWSTLLHTYIKKTQVFVQTSKRNILTLIIAFTSTSILFTTTLVAVIKPIYHIIQNKELEITGLFIVFNIVNTAIYLFLWLLLCRIIKLILVSKQNKEERLKLETSLKESQLNTLKGQINPHFMFNSLNNIRGLMLEDVDKSREMITRLSDMLRYTLTKNKVDIISLNEELDMVNNFVELSKIQFENRLKFTSSVDAHLLETKIPPMIIQILIENAVKHGISDLLNGGEINLSIHEQNKELIIIVENSGKLSFTKSSTKVGLENIKKRLDILYKGLATFNLTEKDATVIATIKLPL